MATQQSRHPRASASASAASTPSVHPHTPATEAAWQTIAIEDADITFDGRPLSALFEEARWRVGGREGEDVSEALIWPGVEREGGGEERRGR